MSHLLQSIIIHKSTSNIINYQLYDTIIKNQHKIQHEIKDKYKADSASVVPAGDDVVLFDGGNGPLGVGSQVMSQDGGAAGAGPNASFGGLQMTSDYGSGVAPATWEYQQAQQPLSAAVKKYGGGGAFGGGCATAALPRTSSRSSRMA